MKAILLALLGTVVYLGLVTLVLRVASTQRRAAALLYLFLGTLPVVLAIHVLTPPSFGILPPDFMEASPWIDRAFGLYLYTAAFFGGSLQLYNLAERGFSLRVLIDVLESPTGAMTKEQALRRYGGGRGIGWMYQKRLDGLREQRLIDPQAARLKMTPRGERTAGVFRSLRSLFCLGLWS
jgi:hypothetical protein